MDFTRDGVEQALTFLQTKLGVAVDPALQRDYEYGRAVQSLSYDKLQPSNGLPILTRYLIAAAAFLHQPCPFYDIFRACRATIYIQLLAGAVRHLSDQKIAQLDERLERLKDANDYDVFDSGMFELLTAWRYSRDLLSSSVAFVPETAEKKTPDFSYNVYGVEYFCECKKVNRSDLHTVRMRNAARDVLNPVITSLRNDRISASAEIIFHEDPAGISSAKIEGGIHDALMNQTSIVERGFTTSAIRLRAFESDSYVLYPSPQFYWDRYGYRHRSDWFGLVQQLGGELVQPNGEPLNESIPFSTWLADVWWDVGIKWKISNEDIVARYRRFAFNNVFSALAQIETQPINSTAHIWVESEYYLQGRSDTLRNLFHRIQDNARDLFGWLIVNETLLDVSPKGLFDMIEHCHIIEGPTAATPKAPVTAILTRHSIDPVIIGGEFGVGTPLPDIDE
jgi:hypothetical protein